MTNGCNILTKGNIKHGFKEPLNVKDNRRNRNVEVTPGVTFILPQDTPRTNDSYGLHLCTMRCMLGTRELGSNLGPNLGPNLGSNLGPNLGSNLGSNLGPNLGPNQLTTGTAIDPPPADFNIPTSNFHVISTITST